MSIHVFYMNIEYVMRNVKEVRMTEGQAQVIFAEDDVPDPWGQLPEEWVDSGTVTTTEPDPLAETAGTVVFDFPAMNENQAQEELLFELTRFR